MAGAVLSIIDVVAVCLYNCPEPTVYISSQYCRQGLCCWPNVPENNDEWGGGCFELYTYSIVQCTNCTYIHMLLYGAHANDDIFLSLFLHT